MGGGTIAEGMVDVYPLKPAPVMSSTCPCREVERLIGIPFTADEAADILRRLQFGVRRTRATCCTSTVPDHRVDIGTGDVGIADLCEEIARIYGYDRIPEHADRRSAAAASTTTTR